MSGKHARQRNKSKAPRAVAATPVVETPPPGAIVVRAAALAVFAAALIVYALTLYASVPGGDSAELILVAQNLGVAHPPGYPLFTLLAKLFTFIPFGTIAWRVNLFSATCDAAAAALLFAALVRWPCALGPSLLAAGLFASSPLVWADAVAAEVFPLNNLFIAGLLYAVIRFRDEPRIGIAYAGAFWMGLAMTNHQAFVFYGLPCGLWVLWHGRGLLLRPKVLASLAGLFALGLAPYAYLPFGSQHMEIWSWGDASTVHGFLTHLLRREYGTFQLASQSAGAAADGELFARLGAYFARIPSQVGYLGVPFVLVGLVTSLKGTPRQSIGWLLAVCFAFYVGVFFSLSNLTVKQPLLLWVQSRFWQQANVLIFVWLGLGVAALLPTLPRQLARPPVVTALCAACVALQAATHFHSHDRSRCQVSRNFAAAVLEPLPPATLLISAGDHVTAALRYYQLNDGLRRDVRIVDHVMLTSAWMKPLLEHNLPDVVVPGARLDPAGTPGTFNLRQFFDANRSRAPIYVVDDIRVPDDSYTQGYTLWPLGMTAAVLERGTELPFDEWIGRSNEMFARIDVRSLAGYPAGSWEWETLRQYWHSKHALGGTLILYARTHRRDQRAARLAAQTLEDVTRQGVYVSPWVWKNLGAAYELLTDSDPAAREQLRYAWKQYLAGHPWNDPDLPAIQKAVSGNS
jgi:hypothetical protein